MNTPSFNQGNVSMSSHMLGGFDFDTQDDLINEGRDLFDNIQVN